MKINFFGAAQNVTGSKHLIQTDGFNLLLDCGLFQGRRSESNKQNGSLPFDAKSIDAMILSHGHADHCGNIPTLVKEGFAGKIYCTNATADIAKLIMMDSANVQRQDLEYLNRHLKPDENPIEPLYTSEDVANVFPHFQTEPYFKLSHQWTYLNPNVRFKFYDAGHILGSEITYLQIKEKDTTHTLAFSGDIGQENVPLLASPEVITEPVGNLLLECTYGDRIHAPLNQAVLQMKEAIGFAMAHGSKLIVPCFALGRTQEVIYLLHKLFNEHPELKIPVYVDSPLAHKLVEVFNHHGEDYNTEVFSDFGSKHQAPLKFPGLIYVESSGESKLLNTVPGPVIIISSSGMMEGGRILHHLKNNISDPNNMVLITGYQAQNTLGRRIKDGVSPIRILGEMYDVRAKVKVLDEFSAHADQNGLLEYVGKLKGLKNLYLVHTELAAAETFKAIVQKKFPTLNIVIPSPGQIYEN